MQRISKPSKSLKKKPSSLNPSLTPHSSKHPNTQPILTTITPSRHATSRSKSKKTSELDNFDANDTPKPKRASRKTQLEQTATSNDVGAESYSPGGTDFSFEFLTSHDRNDNYSPPHNNNHTLTMIFESTEQTPSEQTPKITPKIAPKIAPKTRQKKPITTTTPSSTPLVTPAPPHKPRSKLKPQKYPILPIHPSYDPTHESIFSWFSEQHTQSTNEYFATAEANLFPSYTSVPSSMSLVGNAKWPFVNETWLRAQLHPELPQIGAKLNVDDEQGEDSNVDSRTKKKKDTITPTSLELDPVLDPSLDGESTPATIPSPTTIPYYTHQNLKILNTSWQVLFDTATLSLYQSYLSSRIPTAQYFDMESSSITSSYKPLAFSTISSYLHHITRLDIDIENDSIVLYDYNGLLGAAYAHWILSMVGVQPDRIRILHGGWQGWIQSRANQISGGPIAEVKPRRLQSNEKKIKYFSIEKNVKKIEQIYHIDDNEMFDLGYAHHCAITNNFIADELPVIIDTRSKDRFHGSMREPIGPSSIIGGHIPGSVNIPYADLLTLSDAGIGVTLKSPLELEHVFNAQFDLPKDLKKEFIVTSGTGTTAAVARLALISMGYNNVRLYSNGWSVYGNKAAFKQSPRPVEVGESKLTQILKM
jgi:thiosulfate/3-mercaptopyruvate sulfurtransferase